MRLFYAAYPELLPIGHAARDLFVRSAVGVFGVTRAKIDCSIDERRVPERAADLAADMPKLRTYA
jgi:hypothetical protein